MLGLTFRSLPDCSSGPWVRVGVLISTLAVASTQACSDDGSPPKEAESPPAFSIGTPCIPFNESVPLFATSAGVTLYQDSAACGGEICLAYHFQGRVTCPYGQSEADLTKPATDPGRCRVTDVTGKMTTDPVTVEVPPQLLDRRAERSVYCSCACSGTEPGHEYCSCPSEMACEQLSARGPRMTVTGICVRHDSAYDPRNASMNACNRDATDPTSDCGNNGANP